METGSHYVAQAGLELLGSSSLSLASQSAGITDVSHHTQLIIQFILKSSVFLLNLFSLLQLIMLFADGTTIFPTIQILRRVFENSPLSCTSDLIANLYSSYFHNNVYLSLLPQLSPSLSLNQTSVITL